MEEIRESFLDQFHSWMSRELQKDYIAIFIDAYHTDLKTDNKVKKSVVYTFVHLLRNITRNLACDDASLFNQELKIIKLEDNFDTALQKINALLDSLSK